jgi:hypothetical protein
MWSNVLVPAATLLRTLKEDGDAQLDATRPEQE